MTYSSHRNAGDDVRQVTVLVQVYHLAIVLLLLTMSWTKVTHPVAVPCLARQERVGRWWAIIWAMTALAHRLLPDLLWQRILPLLPPPPSPGAWRRTPNRLRPGPHGRGPVHGPHLHPWALLPVGEFGCGSVTTRWRRFAEWARAGVFERLQKLLLDELGAAGALDWSRVSVDSFSLRAVRGT